VSKIVLDASAVLAYLNDEAGGDSVSQPLETGQALMSTVNMAEVAARMIILGATAETAANVLRGLSMQMIALDETQALLSAKLMTKTKPYGLSLGDRCCIALAQQLELPVMTADRIWAEIDFGIDVQVIR
jgi:PIN domain nuclease of toxin-antitoxin system